LPDITITLETRPEILIKVTAKYALASQQVNVFGHAGAADVAGIGRGVQPHHEAPGNLMSR
jgi:hypothetical protein